MSDSTGESRTLTSLSNGARWSIVLGLPFLMLAAYFYLTPISLAQGGREGGYFFCGSAASPNVEAAKTCDGPETSNRYKAAAALGAGLGVPVLGLVLFGTTRRTQSARDIDLRHDDDLDEDRDGLRRDEREARHERRGRRSPFDDERRRDEPARGRTARRRDEDDDVDSLDLDDEPRRARRRSDDDWDR
ncbi:hypothetical protein EEW87_006760 [Janibacter melonis]|uniref:Transmembrane protein n=1 Tax=Janibacter melonis TaxID=262209 RepID=A0A5P8FKM0_9MICO|nr:hypothetical protein [Janibacter melonis]QFQ30076.1 hypothetical protein EEW87_006760 [Janibacter melonis]